MVKLFICFFFFYVIEITKVIMDTQSHQMKRNIEMKQLDGCTMINPKPNQVIIIVFAFKIIKKKLYK